jgi:uncharacterized membrane protein
MFLFDVAPPVETSTVGIAVGVIFFFIAIAAGVFSFVMLRKTVKMAIRMIVVAATLIIALVGGIALYLFMKPAPRQYNRPIPRTSTNSTR